MLQIYIIRTDKHQNETNVLTSLILSKGMKFKVVEPEPKWVNQSFDIFVGARVSTGVPL